MNLTPAQRQQAGRTPGRAATGGMALPSAGAREGRSNGVFAKNTTGVMKQDVPLARLVRPFARRGLPLHGQGQLPRQAEPPSPAQCRRSTPNAASRHSCLPRPGGRATPGPP